MKRRQWEGEVWEKEDAEVVMRVRGVGNGMVMERVIDQGCGEDIKGFTL